MTIKTIGVIGAGQMGAGIAQVAAVSGYDVILSDIKQEFIDRGMGGVQKSLAKFVEKGKMAADAKDAALARIKTTLDLNDMRTADLVVEAVIEDLELKRKIFRQLDEVCPAHAIEFLPSTKRIRIYVAQCIFCSQCTNICPLGTFYCGPVEDCLDIGHPTYGVCRP